MKKTRRILVAICIQVFVLFFINTNTFAQCPITVTITPSAPAICAGESVILTAASTDLATTWVWSTTEITAAITVSPTITTTYTVTGTLASGPCTSSATVTVTVNDLPFTSFTTSPSNSVCIGTAVTLCGTGAGPGATYTWLPIIAMPDCSPFTPAVTTNYTVTGTDANGCSATAQVTITVKPLPPISASPNQAICAGLCATISASGAGVGGTYTWAPFGGPGTPTVVCPVVTTTFTVTGCNVITGCCNTATTTVTVNPLPVVGFTAVPGTTVCIGTSVTLCGTGADSYTWVPLPIPDCTPIVPPLGITTYTVTGTIAATGCTNTAAAAITVNPLPVVGFTVAPNDTVCAGTSITLCGTGAVSYVWSPVIPDCGAFVPPLGNTTYTVTGTDINGCTNTATVTITVNPLPIVVASNDTLVCQGFCATLSETGNANTCVWNPGAIPGDTVVVCPIALTTYTVTCTITATGCTNTDVVIVTVDPPVPVGFTAAPGTTVCAGTTVTLCGTGATSYTWANPPLSPDCFMVTPLVTTSYTVTGTGAFGCTSSAVATITVNPLPVVSYTFVPDTIVCSGTNVTLCGTGASSYVWAPVIPDCAPFSHPLGVTVYTVTGTDAFGCTNTASVSITVNPNPVLVVTVAPNDTVCAGTPDTLTVSGADTYLWMPGGSTNDSIFVAPIVTTCYTVTGTFTATGCTSSAIICITVNPLPPVSFTAAPSTTVCLGSSVTLCGTGALPGSYVWNPPMPDCVAFFPPLGVTSYTVTGTDALGCTNTAVATITVNPIPIVGFTIPPNDTICAGSTLSLCGTGATSYIWTGPGAVADCTAFTPPFGSTTYTVVGTTLGCSDSAFATVFVLPILVVTAGSNSPVCFGSPINLTSLPPGAATYSWTGPNGFTALIQNPSVPAASMADTGWFVVNVIDTNGCSGIDSVHVDVVPIPGALIIATPGTSICIGDSVLLTSAFTAASYLWSTGSVNDSVMVTPTADSTFSLTLTNPSFCNGNVMDFVTILVFAYPVANITASTNDTICFGSTSFLTATGGGTYLWDFLAITAGVSVTVTSDTIFSVIVTTPPGCADTAFFAMSTFSLPLAPVITSSTPALCNFGDSLDLYSSYPDSIVWTPGGSINDTLTVDSAGMYQVTYTDSNGCTSSANIVIAFDSVIVSILGNTVLCPGFVDSLTASGGITYVWGPGPFTGNPYVVTPVVATTYTVLVTNASGCTGSDSITVTPFNMAGAPIANDDSLGLYENQLAFIDLILNDSNASTITIITPTVNGIGVLNITTINYTPNPDFVGMDSLQYVICDSICSQVCDTAWLYIYVLTDAIDIPQVITPNGDGINDNWIIGNIGLYPDNEVLLMDRWGDIIYQEKPYLDSWYGQSNTGIQIFGNNLSSGTYYFIIRLDATSDPIKGFIELVK